MCLCLCRKGRHVQSPDSTIRTSPEPMQILSRIISPTTTPLEWLSWTVWAPGTSRHCCNQLDLKRIIKLQNVTGVVKQGIYIRVHFSDTSLRALAPVLVVIYGQSRLLSGSHNACGRKVSLHCRERSAFQDLSIAFHILAWGNNQHLFVDHGVILVAVCQGCWPC